MNQPSKHSTPSLPAADNAFDVTTDPNPTIPATPPESPPLLLTIEQAADRLAVGRCTMQTLLTSGEVKSFKIGRLRRVPPEALDEYIARQMGS